MTATHVGSIKSGASRTPSTRHHLRRRWGGMATLIDYWAGPGELGGLAEAKTQLAELAVLVADHFWSLVEEDTPLAGYPGIDVSTLISCGTRSLSRRGRSPGFLRTRSARAAPHDP